MKPRVFPNFKPQYTTWLQRLLLLFVPTNTAIDGNYYVKTKTMFGQIYVVDSGYLLPESMRPSSPKER